LSEVNHQILPSPGDPTRYKLRRKISRLASIILSKNKWVTTLSKAEEKKRKKDV